MKRLNYKYLWLFFLSALVFIGLMSTDVPASSIFKNDKESKLIIVFIDMSGSTNKVRQTIYKNAFEMIYKSLKQGDRIVVGTITSHSYIDFKPVVDEEIPKQTIWVNRLKFEQNLTRTKKNIRETVDQLLKLKQGTKYTEILNSLNIADTIFHSEKKRKKILVLLSDMIQDSKEYNFEKVKITNQYIANIIKNRTEQELIPNLSKVKIYVAGASASSSKRFRAVELIWTRYFKACNADFSTHRYGHSLLEFEKGSGS
ncbi:MAG: hypothetical protein K8R67_03510 [Desulfobacteraceae bacterium]|nr:hypothetical protein [Desulfobacteraceae bacterium]